MGGPQWRRQSPASCSKAFLRSVHCRGRRSKPSRPGMSNAKKDAGLPSQGTNDAWARAGRRCSRPSRGHQWWPRGWHPGDRDQVRNTSQGLGERYRRMSVPALSPARSSWPVTPTSRRVPVCGGSLASAASRKVPSPAGRLNPRYRNREWNLPRLAAVCSRVRCGAVRCRVGLDDVVAPGGGFAIRSARVWLLSLTFSAGMRSS